jgi:hypothetical protein
MVSSRNRAQHDEKKNIEPLLYIPTVCIGMNTSLHNLFDNPYASYCVFNKVVYHYFLYFEKQL